MLPLPLEHVRDGKFLSDEIQLEFIVEEPDYQLLERLGAVVGRSAGRVREPDTAAKLAFVQLSASKRFPRQICARTGNNN